MKNKIKDFFSTNGSYLLLFFLVINIVCGQHAGNNANSRFALLRMMSEKQTFEISTITKQDSIFWTDDWSQTPNGKQYSNKAPGSSFLAFPIFFILDKINKASVKNQSSESFIISKPSRTTRKLSAIVTQVLLFITLIICLQRKKYLPKEFDHPKNLSLLLTLLFFANTSSNYMNTLFGHGLAAALSFWFANSLWKKNYTQLGIAFGLALLNDYSFAFFILPALYVIFQSSNRLTHFLKFIKAGVPFGILWSWYHYICFGSPFSIANKFQNPKYIDVQTGSNLWGIIDLNFNFEIMGKLLWGAKRGILITQPWVIVSIVFLIYFLFSKEVTKKIKTFFALNLITFTLLLCMNSSFGGWHGGSTIGPRYLAIIFPWLAFSTLLVWDKVTSMVFRSIFYGSVLYSVLFYVLVSSASIHGNQDYLLDELFAQLSHDPARSIKRAIVCIFCISIGLILESKRRCATDQENI